MALDWGDVRIGVARCDPDGVLASPYATVAAGEREIEDVLKVLREVEPIEVLVGLPTSLSGTAGPAAVKARERAMRLAAATPTPIRLVDERLSTVSAARQLREGGRRARQQRTVIDAAAAATILEQALAAERAQGKPPGELVSGATGPA